MECGVVKCSKVEWSVVESSVQTCKMSQDCKQCFCKILELWVRFSIFWPFYINVVGKLG